MGVWDRALTWWEERAAADVAAALGAGCRRSPLK